MGQKYKEEHDRLRVMLEAYIGLMGRRTQPDITEVMRHRLAFANAFRAHIASEGPALDALRTGDGNHPVDRKLDQHGCRLREVLPGYSALIRDWTPPRIVADWPTYCREVRAQTKRYLAFLEWEEAEVLPLFDVVRRHAYGQQRPIPSVNASYRATSSG